MGQKNSKPCGKYLRELHRKVPNMNRDDIINAYEDFRKQSGGKDRLTKKDFVKVYKQAFGTNGAQQLAENIFNSFDKDGSGTVDFEEFLVGLSITEGIADFHSDEEYREKILKWSFNVYDKDKNNHIDRDEMRHIVHAVSDIIPDENFLRGKSANQVADELFDSVDLDKSGHITFDEFKAAAEKDPMIVELLQPAPNN